MSIRWMAAALLAAGLLAPKVALAGTPGRITVLYDAFGEPSALKKDWGFAALVEYGGKRILFDAGNDAEIFEHNAKALGVDPASLDFVVVSHRHGDHTTGLRYVLEVNPDVAIYVPSDEPFMASTPTQMYRRGVESLPKHMRYFDGVVPEAVPHGTAWPGAKMIRVASSREVAPGIGLVATTSKKPGTLEMPELSLRLRTPEGPVLVVGCSHAGIEAILERSEAADKPVQLLVGGLHLVTTPDPEVERIATALHDRWKVARVAVGHCTGEPGFAALRRVFGDRYAYAGLGTVHPLP